MDILIFLQMSLNNTERQRKPVPRCVHCDEVTLERCTGCNVYFCAPKCMLEGYKHHAGDCIQMPYVVLHAGIICSNTYVNFQVVSVLYLLV